MSEYGRFDLRYVRTDKNGTKIYHDENCPRCCGYGELEQWAYTGRVCFACGGTGKRPKPKVVKIYTPEYADKLEQKRQAREAKRLLENPPPSKDELEAKADETRRNNWEYRTMGKWLDIKGAVVADTVYADNVLVAKDVSFTLLGIEFVTADVQAMGNMTVPLVGLLENMELAITKIGVDMGLSRLNRLQKQNLEFRWVQNVIKSDGSQKSEGCKAFVRTLPGALPAKHFFTGNTK